MAAKTSTITCFLYAKPEEIRARSDMFWDEIELRKIADAPEVTMPAGTVAVKTKSKTGQNIRGHHSLIAPIAGSLEAGETAYTSADEAPAIGQARAWVYIKAPGGEGWAAAWLLEAA